MRLISPLLASAAASVLLAGLCGWTWLAFAGSPSPAAAARSAQNAPKAQPPAPPKPAPADAVSFLAFGDCGSGLPAQRRLAAQMLARYERRPFATALVLGDIIYETGDFQRYGQSRYRQVYAPLMERGVIFRPVLGNHDVVTGFKPQALTFYGMPGRYYRFRQGPVDFFALDTNLADDPLQRRWLSQALAQSDAPWKIVYGHHPAYSSGAHGVNEPLRRWLEPLLIQYGVALYLAGHDHDYERIGPIRGVTHVVSGGGGASLRGFSAKPLATSQARASAYHFILADATAQTLSWRAIDVDGNELDAVTLKAPAAAKTATGSNAR